MKQPIKTSLVVSAGLAALAGLVAVPAAVNAVTSTTTVNAIISDVISLTTSGTVNLAITPTAAGSFTSASDTVTVGTNKTTGYNLKIKGATTTLANGAESLAATSGTFASPGTVAANQWGYRVDNLGTFGAGPTTAQSNATSLTGTWAGMTTTDVQIKSTAAANASDVTTVWYGAGADLSKPSGTYTNTITYTATNN